MSSATMSNSGEKMVAEARGCPSRTRSPRRRRELGFGGLGLLDRDHPLVADLLRRVGDQLADRLVAVGRDRADLGDLRTAPSLTVMSMPALDRMRGVEVEHVADQQVGLAASETARSEGAGSMGRLLWGALGAVGSSD
jgi:hypothetical protein